MSPAAVRRIPFVVCTLAALAGALAGTPGCAGTGDADRSLSRLEGRIIADPLPSDARVEVHRSDDSGLLAPLVGFDVRPDRTGAFRTQPLPEGRYVLVLRSREVPPAFARSRVPQAEPVRLRPGLPTAGATIVLTAPPGRSESLRCRLAAPDLHGGVLDVGVLDVREVVLVPGQDVRLHGLRPGVWKLDVTNFAATTELAVAGGDAPQRFLVDPPMPDPANVGIRGTVIRTDGTPARGVVVSGWSMSDDDRNLVAWGRYSEVGPDGGYRVFGLSPGRGMVRVELRAATARILPPAEMIEIPPSGDLERGFTIEP